MIDEYLILVNQQYRICGEPDDLVSVSSAYEQIKLRRTAQAALTKLLCTIGSGDQIVPVSGYRSREEQTVIYETSLLENGAEFTRKYVALPGCSEHQTGLAIDLAMKREVIDFIRPDFPYDGICGQFRKLAPKYGFIERYPLGKEQITGIAHEPWHFRYVGCPHAEILTAQNLTLEEYIKNYDKYQKYISLQENAQAGAIHSRN